MGTRENMIRTMSIADRLAAIGIAYDRQGGLWAGTVYLGQYDAYDACVAFLDAPGDA